MPKQFDLLMDGTKLSNDQFREALKIVADICMFFYGKFFFLTIIGDGCEVRISIDVDEKTIDQINSFIADTGKEFVEARELP